MTIREKIEEKNLLLFLIWNILFLFWFKSL